MNMPMYCRACDMITGHDILGWNIKCSKCGLIRKAPLLRWGFLVALVLLLMSIPIYLVCTAIAAFV